MIGSLTFQELFLLTYYEEGVLLVSKNEEVQFHCSIEDLQSIANDHIEIPLNKDEALQLLIEWKNETEEMLWNYFYQKLEDWRNENDT